jgi:PAS domain S-box-containing protein
LEINGESTTKSGLGNISLQSQELLEALPAAVYTCDIDGRINFFNQAAADLWGCVPRIGIDSWCGAWKIYDGDMNTIPAERYPMAAVLAGRKIPDGQQFYIERPDGTMLEVWPCPTAIYGADGVMLGAVDMPINLSEIKTKEKKIEVSGNMLTDLNAAPENRIREGTATLADSEQRYHKMIDEVQEYAILLLDLDGNIMNWNKGAQKIKGYSEKEIVGKNFSLFYLPEDRESNLPGSLIHEAHTKGKAKHEGWRLRKDGSSFWGNIVITALHGDDGSVIGFSKVTRDLTERKLAEDRLMATAASLELRNKQLEEYAYVASHDLQEPLRKIQTFAQMLKASLSDPESAKQKIDKIISSAQRMSQLIMDLLKYSQVLHSEDLFVPIDLNEVLKNVAQDFDLLIEQRNAAIKVSRLPQIKGIPVQIHQLFSNLLSNALKFSNEMPLIEVTAQMATYEDICEFIGTDDARNFYWLAFTDNGMGFDQKFADQAFKMFQRLTETKTGTGIGLSLCKRIVENHGGFMTVSSMVGKGTTFRILLPE